MTLCDEANFSAQTACSLCTLEGVRTGQFAGRMVRVLERRKAKGLGDAVVADRLGREPGDELFDGMKFGDAPAPSWCRPRFTATGMRCREDTQQAMNF